MLSIGLWEWYINITITILDIIHRPVFYVKQNSLDRKLDEPQSRCGVRGEEKILDVAGTRTPDFLLSSQLQYRLPGEVEMRRAPPLLFLRPSCRDG
jgi:hypothetical protein